jgi:HTH-type transcriptional regulator/antitoxin HigA
MVKLFPLTLIKSESHLQQAETVIDDLLRRANLDDGETDYLEVLSDLVASYEEQHYPFEPSSDADMLRHLMEAKGVSQTDLHHATGIQKSTISEILGGRRTFSKGHIARLAEYFHVPKSLLTRNL